MRKLYTIIPLLMMVLCAVPAMGANETDTWDGSEANNLFADTNNWSGSTVPNGTGTAIFTTVDAGGTVIITNDTTVATMAMVEGSKTIAATNQTVNATWSHGINRDSAVTTVNGGTLDGTHNIGAEGATDNAEYVELNGSVQYVSVPDSDDYTFGDGATDSPFSVAAWVNMDDATSFILTAKIGLGAQDEWSFGMDGSDKVQFYMTSLSGGDGIVMTADSANTADEGSWHLFVGTYNGGGATSDIKLYRDAAELAATGWTFGSYTAMTNSTSDVWIGRQGNSYSDGGMDEIMVFSKELTLIEIQTLYARLVYGLHNEDTTSLVSEHRFEGDTADSSGNGHTATLVSGATITEHEHTSVGSATYNNSALTNATINIAAGDMDSTGTGTFASCSISYSVGADLTVGSLSSNNAKIANLSITNCTGNVTGDDVFIGYNVGDVAGYTNVWAKFFCDNVGMTQTWDEVNIGVGDTLYGELEHDQGVLVVTTLKLGVNNDFSGGQAIVDWNGGTLYATNTFTVSATPADFQFSGGDVYLVYGSDPTAEPWFTDDVAGGLSAVAEDIGGGVWHIYAGTPAPTPTGVTQRGDRMRAENSLESQNYLKP